MTPTKNNTPQPGEKIECEGGWYVDFSTKDRPQFGGFVTQRSGRKVSIGVFASAQGAISAVAAHVEGPDLGMSAPQVRWFAGGHLAQKDLLA